MIKTLIIFVLKVQHEEVRTDKPTNPIDFQTNLRQNCEDSPCKRTHFHRTLLELYKYSHARNRLIYFRIAPRARAR